MEHKRKGSSRKKRNVVWTNQHHVQLIEAQKEHGNKWSIIVTLDQYPLLKGEDKELLRRWWNVHKKRKLNEVVDEEEAMSKKPAKNMKKTDEQKNPNVDQKTDDEEDIKFNWGTPIDGKENDKQKLKFKRGIRKRKIPQKTNEQKNLNVDPEIIFTLVEGSKVTNTLLQKILDNVQSVGTSIKELRAENRPDPYKRIIIPEKLIQRFSDLAIINTSQNIETCGLLAGTMKSKDFQVTTLIVPKQKGTSNTCDMLNENEMVKSFEDNHIINLGWIHTHPLHDCFLSSVDLHTHYAYQRSLRESIAIVLAHKDEMSVRGIFHLSPAGMKVIESCQKGGFHEHELPDESLYRSCSHVVIDHALEYVLIDLR